MGCSFCASTIDGCVRNLSASEMIDQVLKVQKDQCQKITHVVVMGSGEPLLNYDEVIKFLKVLNSPLGFNISFRRMTVSTCGIVPVIYKLADENLPITLSVSLHAPMDSLRNRIMPINKKFPLHELIEAVKFYVERTGRRITFEYVLIKGLNDSKLCAENLVKLIRDINCHVNLIPANPIAERDIERPKPETINEFKRLLEQNGIKVTVRRELGRDIDAACGQLRRKVLKEGVINPL
jgi:23S rRNA (adenine2503-C2)-methyltransferase